jgi:uncharacterized protein YjlB
MTHPAPILRRFADDGVIPNNPVLPVVLLPGALDPGLSAEQVAALHRSNGWGGGWTWGVYEHHHWHPNAHEALSVVSGWANLMLGGPSGETFRVSAGDSLVLPAGTGHRRLEASADFLVRGCYPPGQEGRDILGSDPADRAQVPRIARVPLPETDPLFGPQGPLVQAWRSA